MTQPRHNLLGIHGHQLRQVHRVRTLHKLRLGFIAILIVLITGGGFAVLRKHSDNVENFFAFERPLKRKKILNIMRAPYIPKQMGKVLALHCLLL